MDDSVSQWVRLVQQRLPTGMVRFVQLRLRAGTLALALSPPAGFSLGVEMHREGFVCLIFSPIDHSSDLHTWAIHLDQRLGADANRTAYPAPLPLQVNWKVFLPLFGKQDTNRDASLELVAGTGVVLHSLVIPLSAN